MGLAHTPSVLDFELVWAKLIYPVDSVAPWPSPLTILVQPTLAIGQENEVEIWKGQLDNGLGQPD